MRLLTAVKRARRLALKEFYAANKLILLTTSYCAVMGTIIFILMRTGN